MPIEELRAIALLSRVSYGRVSASMRALPFLAVAQHIVSDGCVVLRMHAGHGHHDACAGSVVAYAADNLGSGDAHLWSVQFTGTAELTKPAPEEFARFEPAPAEVNGEPYEAVYLRIRPQFATLDRMEYPASDSLTPLSVI
ncbi:pyridoxamine 5'-phosphate oxidase family protein [Streptomyces sp. NBC_01387]|uniref:pyridoxamine 5'-phosphate oxidase family protein n=1 Tax=unclassified Streptomyces TaxID=2593676 RepID=UPI0020249EED|nr:MULTISPECIES: pyridoxamine 5'-phosphate oxidase family protein [unclassified Streptomyces]WSC21227.1 pyridoxamine 5'-phosphate oxidase family protein [Streptomyces sp. NBC_01766]WSV55163.1 pyridoxamine 5'-phosphate oxidase family protein [Streptomyces sp. NBC_01014]